MKKNIKIFFLLLVSFLAVPFMIAESLTLDEFLEKVEDTEKKVKSVEFKFTQKILYTFTKETQSNSGSVIFSKPDKLYMKQSNPIEQVIVSNGKKIWIYTPDYNQVITDNWDRWTKNTILPSSLLNFADTFKDLSRKYEFELKDESETEYKLYLNPKSDENWKLILYFDKKDFIPLRSVLESENITVATDTSDYKINPEIDKGIFNFKKPKDAEIFEMP